MTLVLNRKKAIKLRKRGLTYSEIRSRLGISKSTLSDWLSKYPLTKDQIVTLENTIKRNKYLAIEKIRLTKQKKRAIRLKSIYEEEKNYWLSLSPRELEIAGLFLYWGEGNKNLKTQLSLNNTDPKVLKFTLYWMKKALKIPKKKIKVWLHLYSDMNPNKEIEFWSKTLDIPLSQFIKPYIKKSKREDLDHKGFGHGTCGLAVSDVRLKEKVIIAINAIADSYSEKV